MSICLYVVMSVFLIFSLVRFISETIGGWLYTKIRKLFRLIIILKKRLRKKFNLYVPAELAIVAMYDKIKYSGYWPIIKSLDEFVTCKWPLDDLNSDFKRWPVSLFGSKHLDINRYQFLLHFLIEVSKNRIFREHIGTFSFYGRYKNSRLIEIPNIRRLHFEGPVLDPDTQKFCMVAFRKIDMSQNSTLNGMPNIMYSWVSFKKSEINRLVRYMNEFDKTSPWRPNKFKRFLARSKNKLSVICQTIFEKETDE